LLQVSPKAYPTSNGNSDTDNGNDRDYANLDWYFHLTAGIVIFTARTTSTSESLSGSSFGGQGSHSCRWRLKFNSLLGIAVCLHCVPMGRDVVLVVARPA